MIVFTDVSTTRKFIPPTSVVPKSFDYKDKLAYPPKIADRHILRFVLPGSFNWENSELNKAIIILECDGKTVRNYTQYILHLMLFSLRVFLLTLSSAYCCHLMCICLS